MYTPFMLISTILYSSNNAKHLKTSTLINQMNHEVPRGGRHAEVLLLLQQKIMRLFSHIKIDILVGAQPKPMPIPADVRCRTRAGQSRQPPRAPLIERLSKLLL